MLPTSFATLPSFSTENANNPVARKTVDNSNKNVVARKAFVDLGVNCVQNAEISEKIGNKSKDNVNCIRNDREDLFINDIDEYLRLIRDVDEDVIYAKEVAQVWSEILPIYMKKMELDEEIDLTPPIVIEEEPVKYTLDFEYLSFFDDSQKMYPISEPEPVFEFEIDLPEVEFPSI